MTESGALGEICLRWTMKLPADIPLAPDDKPFDQVKAAGMLDRSGYDGTTLAMVRVAEELLSLDDMRELPQLSPARLANRTGHAQTTVLEALRRLVQVGRKLMAASNGGGMVDPDDWWP